MLNGRWQARQSNQFATRGRTRPTWQVAPLAASHLRRGLVEQSRRNSSTSRSKGLRQGVLVKFFSGQASPRRHSRNVAIL